MAVSVKSPREIELMRKAGSLLATVHEELSKIIRPGVTTWEINRRGEEIIRSFGCLHSFLNYEGYPASICVSVNDEVVHGIPHKKHFLDEGDIVSLDAGLIYQGYHADAARTWAVGRIDPEVQRLLDVTKQSFYEGIKYAKPGYHVNDISCAVQNYVEENGFSVVRDLVGHGVGQELHEEPEVPNFRQDRRGIRLCPGMTIAVEPMVNMGEYEVSWLDDDWTVVTDDGSFSAHYENTILITEGEPEILTLHRQE